MLSPETIIQNRYRLLHTVDERPGGQVFRAHDQHENRPVLLCALPITDAEAREDAELLARQLATVQHEAVLPLLHHFNDSQYYIMVVDDPGGQDLERVLRARGSALAEADVLPQMGKLLDALEHLHQQRPPFFVGELWLSDVWVTDGGAWRIVPYTLARPFVRLPSPYRAPELLNIEAEPSAATDTYAFSALLYHVLTGWPPPSAEQQEVGATLNAPRAMNQQISTLAEQALLRGLQQKPANRYQNARELRLALETVQIMAGRPLGFAPEVKPVPSVVPPESTTVIVDSSAVPVTERTPPEEAAAIQPEPKPESAPPAEQPAIATAPVVPEPDPRTAPPDSPSQPETPPQQPYPTGIYTVPAPAQPVGVATMEADTYPQSAYAVPDVPEEPQPQGGLSTGCLMGLVVVLALMVVGILIALVLIVAGALGRTSGSDVAQQGLQQSITSSTAIPASAARTAGDAAVAPVALGAGAITLQNARLITRTVEITTTQVGFVLYAPNGELLALGIGGDISLRTADALEEERARLSGHTGQIFSLAWSPDSQQLASGSTQDAEVRIWNVQTGELVRTLEGHTGWIRSIAYSPDGALIASGATDGQIRLWNAQNGSLVQVLEGHANWIGSVAFAPDGESLASTSRDGTVRLWDVESGDLRDDFAFETPLNPNTNTRYWTNALAFSPNGELLAVGTISGVVYLLDAQTGVQERELRGHTGIIVNRGLTFTPDGATVLSASDDGTIRAWNTNDGAEAGVFRGHQLSILGITISPDGTSLASTSIDEGQLLLWSVSDQRLINSLRIGKGVTTALAYSPDSSVVGAAGYNGLLQLYQVEQQRSQVLDGFAPAPQPLAFLPRNRLVTITDQGRVAVLDGAAGSVQLLEGVESPALSVSTSVDGRLLAAGTADGTVGVWDMTSGQLIQVVESGLPVAYAVAISGNGSQLAIAGPPAQPVVLIWDIFDNRAVHVLDNATGGITGLAFQSRGSLVAATDFAGTLYVWDSQSGGRVHTIQATAQQTRFTGVAFSPDGEMVVAGALDGELLFWDALSADLVAQHLVSAASVIALAFSPDGAQLAVSIRDTANSVFIYTVDE